MRRWLKVLFLLMFVLLLKEQAHAQRSGPGVFSGVGQCSDVVAPVSGATYCFDWNYGALLVYNSAASGYSQLTGNIVPITSTTPIAYQLISGLVNANVLAMGYFQNTNGGNIAQAAYDTINDVSHNFWIANRSSGYNPPGLPAGSHMQAPDSGLLLADGANGLVIGTDNPGYAPIWMNIGYRDIASVTVNGVNIAHINAMANSGTPTVSNGNLVAGSNDSYGWVINVTGQTTLTFSQQFPAGYQTVCTVNDGGQPLLWYAANQSNMSVTFVCTVPWTGLPCPASSGWVEYHCAGMGG